MKSQNELIKNHLESGKSITALQAFRTFGCMRLSGRIYDLAHEHGLAIHSEMIQVGSKRIARYSIRKPKSCTTNQN